MKPKHKRLALVLASIMFMLLAVSLMLYSFRQSIVFFYTPTQWETQKNLPGFNRLRPVRIGGLVKQDSIVNLDGGGIRFVITDLSHEVPAVYRGLVPSLFRDNQGVVAQGVINEKGEIIASNILAKHDEKYMPREVVDALKASGQWQEGEVYSKDKRK